MAFSWRQGIVFGMGLLLGVMAGAMVLLAWKDSEVQARVDARAGGAQQLAAAEPACTFDPLLPAVHARDGQFSPPAELGDKTVTDILAYVGVGGDAAANGRVRDAEVALITACRIALQVTGASSAELADAQYELARHYTAVAAASPAADANRAELLKRAETLFARSMDLYASKFGRPHEKASLAAAGVTLARHAGLMTSHLQQASALSAAGAIAVGANDFPVQPAAPAQTAKAVEPAEQAPVKTAEAPQAEPRKSAAAARSEQVKSEPARSELAKSEPAKAESTRTAAAPKPPESTKVSAPDTAVMGAAPEVRKPRPKPKVEIEPLRPPEPAVPSPSTGWAESPASSQMQPAPPASLPGEYQP